MAERRYHHGDLRSALLDVAEALIRERGIEGWSLREASIRIGVSPSAAYHHFDSRDVLVRALSERVLARLGEHLGQAAERACGGPHQRLIAVGRSYVRWALEDPAVARLAFSAGRAEPTTPISPHPHDVLVAELDRLVDLGGLAASARPGAEFIVWTAIHGLATLLTDGLIRLDTPEAVDRQVERLTQAVLTGLAHETPPSPAWPTPGSPHTETPCGWQQRPDLIGGAGVVEDNQKPTAGQIADQPLSARIAGTTRRRPLTSLSFRPYFETQSVKSSQSAATL